MRLFAVAVKGGEEKKKNARVLKYTSQSVRGVTRE